jgi:hypothetical protein
MAAVIGPNLFGLEPRAQFEPNLFGRCYAQATENSQGGGGIIGN